MSVAATTAIIWSAPANAAQRWLGLFGVPPSGGVGFSWPMPRKRGTPNKAPSPLRSADTLQICLPKNKIPSPFLPREERQAGDGISFERRIPCGLNTFSRAFTSCNSVPAGLLALFIARRDKLHSGATARDSHPLPYSPRFDAGHPNAFERSQGTRCS